MTCATCRFFHRAPFPTKLSRGEDSLQPGETHRHVESGGSCRRHAPQPLVGGSGTGWSEWEWPNVTPEMFCGQYRDAGCNVVHVPVDSTGEDIPF